MSFSDPLKKQIIDQVLHLAWGIVAGLIVVGLGAHWVAGPLLGLIIALPRELIEQWPISRHSDWWLDTLILVTGGGVGAWIFRVIGS